jgi:hypothetical protein
MPRPSPRAVEVVDLVALARGSWAGDPAATPSRAGCRSTRSPSRWGRTTPPSGRPWTADDWQHLRIGGALPSVLTDLFTHPNVHYLSGFFGLLGGCCETVPTSGRQRLPTVRTILDDPPRVMATAGPSRRGRPVSLSLHAGPTSPRSMAGADPDWLLWWRLAAFLAPTGSATTAPAGRRDRRPHRERQEPIVIDALSPSDVDWAIAEHVRRSCLTERPPDGHRRGAVVVAPPREGDGGVRHPPRCHHRPMQLHLAGKVTNEKRPDGVSVATFGRRAQGLAPENRGGVLGLPRLTGPRAQPGQRSPSTRRCRWTSRVRRSPTRLRGAGSGPAAEASKFDLVDR